MSVARSVAAAQEADRPRRRFALTWAPVIAWTALIINLSSDSFAASETSRWVAWLVAQVYPGADPNLVWLLDWVLRKLAHLGEYAVLGALLLRALETTRTSSPLRAAVTLAALIALGDEGRQSFTASRSASLLDSGLDTCGALVGIWLWRRLPISRGRAVPL